MSAYTNSVSTEAIKNFSTLCKAKKNHENKTIVMVTAYDAPTMRFAMADADIVLVGDSAAMVMLGHESTMNMTHDEMKMLVSAVSRVNESTPVIADMVWGSYHASDEKAVENAVELIHCGANAVKVEGGIERVSTIQALCSAQIPVVGHVGLTPQSILEFGTYSVQGKDLEKAQKVLEDARAVAKAGASMLVVECVPDALSRTITEELDIPVIGIGAGRHVDGQVLVIHDLLGIGKDKKAKFVRTYGDFEEQAKLAISKFAEDVRNGSFPNSNETYHMADDVVAEMEKSNVDIKSAKKEDLASHKEKSKK